MFECKLRHQTDTPGLYTTSQTVAACPRGPVYALTADSVPSQFQPHHINIRTKGLLFQSYAVQLFVTVPEGKTVSLPPSVETLAPCKHTKSTVQVIAPVPMKHLSFKPHVVQT